MEEGRLDVGALLVLTLRREQGALRAFATKAGLGHDLLWLVLDDVPHAHASLVRAVAGRHNAQSALIRASEAQRATLGVFHPQEETLARLTRDVKAAFDPEGVFNPGRMYQGI
jgi:glycolate oxidase FAD binding subunit